MKTELILAVTVTVALIVAVALTLKHAPRRRPLFMFDLVHATFGPERPQAWRPPAAASLSRRQRRRRLAPDECRIADGAESIQTLQRFASIDAPAEAR